MNRGTPVNTTQVGAVILQHRGRGLSLSQRQQEGEVALRECRQDFSSRSLYAGPARGLNRQWCLFANPGDLRSVPGTHMVTGEN